MTGEQLTEQERQAITEAGYGRSVDFDFHHALLVAQSILDNDTWYSTPKRVAS